MTRKRNRFFLFCCSMIPGAGEMYLGFMKQGISLMSLFFLLLSLAAWLNVGALAFLLPVIWCYSFFHAHNLNGLPDDEFYTIEDDFLIRPSETFDAYFLMRYRKLIALVLILLGASIIWNNFMGLMGGFLPSFLHRLFRSLGYYVPQILIGAVIVYAGLYLISGKKKELEDSKEREEH